jgi:dipeptidyl aminopeptidase/acylaminoacyl peptidase
MQDLTQKLLENFASLVTPGEWALSPNRDAIAFTQSVNGVSQIFSMPILGGSSRRLTATLEDCHEPKWSPDAKRIAYTSDDALWVMSADGANALKLTEHPSGLSEPRWSPDGSRIAFYSRRRGWEHIWMIDAKGGTPPRQILKGEFDADDLTWSRDGNCLAYCSMREPDLMTRGIYLVSADGGDSVLISPKGCWSGAPHFSPDGKKVAYLSDRDGWFHIYLFDLNTSQVQQLTHGEFEIGGPFFYNVDPRGGPVFSPDGKLLAYIRHRDGNFDIWVAEANGNAPRRISTQDGHHRIIGWLTDSRRLVAQFDNPANPPAPWIFSTDSASHQMIDLRAGELSSDKIIMPEWVSYKARDDLTIHAGMYCPRERDKRLPVVMFLHGGPNFEFANFFYPLPQLLAQEGYVVFAPNFRGSTGFGTAFRHANFREWGHGDAFDVIDGARWLAQQDFVDADRIAVIGPSYGGYLTLGALTLAPELFCAGVDMYGDSEIAESFRHGDRHGRLDLQRQMGKPEENPEGYRRGSPVYLAERIQAPLLILHGKEDQLVVPMMSEKMIEALKIEDKYFESNFYEDEEHGFNKPENKKDAWERVIKFLNKYCKGENV